MTDFKSILAAIQWLDAWGVKSYAYYRKTIMSAVRTFYADQITGKDFLDIMSGLINGQMMRAWGDGMKDNGLLPSDMTDTWQRIVDGIAESETSHLQEYANDVLDARLDGASIDPLLLRAEMWADRYNDVRNRARLETAPKVGPDGKPTMFEWKYNPLKEHCPTCKALDGLIASVDEWRQSQYHPYADWDGNLPNKMLGCNGWRCGCNLMPTDKARNIPEGANIADVVKLRSLGAGK